MLLFFINIIWLTELREILPESLNGPFKYACTAIILLAIGSVIRFHKSKLIGTLSLVFFFIIILLNLYHLSFNLSIFSILMFPFLLILFYKNTKVTFNINYLFIVFNIIIAIYAIPTYLKIISGSHITLNPNELSSVSFAITSFVIMYSEIYKNENNKIIYFNILLTLLISYFMDARAIFISVFFLIMILFSKNFKFLKSFIVYFLATITFLVPLVILIFVDELKILHESILILNGAAADVIEADLDRYEMFELVKNILDQDFLGKGIGNTEFYSVINISGLHSGSLDLLYWGGYILFFVFMLSFIFIILYTYNKYKTFITSSILIYWLLLINYYEGLLFGNMGLTVFYIYFLMANFNGEKNEFSQSKS